MSDNRLPNAQRAIIDPAKTTGYLLNADHPDGGSKAVFFIQHGFSPVRPEELIAALLAHAMTADVVTSANTVHGTKYVLRGMLQARDGRTPWVQAIWIVNAGQDTPRFVTAYPARRGTADERT